MTPEELIDIIYEMLRKDDDETSIEICTEIEQFYAERKS